MLGNIFRFIDVALGEDDVGCGGVRGCEAGEDGGDLFAWSAPGCVEVDDEEGRLFESVELGEGFDFLHFGLRWWWCCELKLYRLGTT